MLFVLLGFNSSGQVSDTSFYSTGTIKSIKFYQGNKIIKAACYKPDKQIQYRWDINKKTLESFDAISYADTLTAYFTSSCPDYTLLQHYGNGPLMEIEHYKAGKRHGLYQKFDRDGHLLSEGQFDNWQKVGIWTYNDENGNHDRQIHWFHHSYYGEGISIYYTVVPVAVALLFISIMLLLFLKRSTFFKFYVCYSLLTIGLFAALFLIGTVASERVMLAIRNYFGEYLFSTLTTFVLAAIIFSVLALLLKKRTGVKRRISVLFLATSFILLFFLLSAYVGSKVAAAAVM